MLLKTPSLLFATTALALASCAPSPYDTQNHTNQGALYGAVIGGLAGSAANKHDHLLGAATGAALGAVVGGAIGSNLDKQAADLRGQLANSGITVTNKGKYLVVNTPSDLLFPTDSAVVSRRFYPELRKVANSLIQYPNTNITVVGHTDSTGTLQHNMVLSRQRARAVADILISDGVAPGRVRAVGVGPRQPVATNATVLGREQNRRVEIVVRPTNQ